MMQCIVMAWQSGAALSVATDWPRGAEQGGAEEKSGKGKAESGNVLHGEAMEEL